MHVNQRRRRFGALDPRRPVETVTTAAHLLVRRRRADRIAEDEPVSDLRPLVAEGDPPVPPARLRHLVSGTTDPGDFLDTGRRHSQAIADAAERAHAPFGSGVVVADVGCGCGRLLRHWAKSGATLLAGDTNPELLRWVTDNLAVRTFAIDRDPPVPLADGSVDVLVAYSVLTHLPLAGQRAWVHDWRRVVRPGGLLICSTHGRNRRSDLGDLERARFDAGEVVVRRPLAAGHNLCASFLPPAAAAAVFSELTVLEHREPSADDPWDQDLWVLRRPK